MKSKRLSIQAGTRQPADASDPEATTGHRSCWGDESGWLVSFLMCERRGLVQVF